MEVLKLLGGVTLIAAMLAFPETTLNAAREAMGAWYMSVAPSLFPFMALMPVLTAPSAAAVWERLLGRWMRPVLNLPGSAAPALAAGLIGGAPAGAAAAVRCPGLTCAEIERLVCCSGLSPAFLITGVGASMLGSPADGRLLLRAQLLSQAAMLLLTRSSPQGEPASAPALTDDAPVRTAVTNVLAVCGYMMLFSVAAALLSGALRSETAGLAALCVLDMPSAARALAEISIERTGKLLLLAAVTGFGGLCIAAQNLAVSRKYGVRTKKYLLSRLSHAALNVAFAALLLRFEGGNPGKSLPPLEFSALICAFFAVPALISLKKDPFLNKRNFEKMRGL